MTHCHTLAVSNGIDEKLREAMHSFSQLVDACPPELRAKYFVRREAKDGFLWVEIRTTFKVPMTQGEA